ncbi:hypothetical protein CAPTEDRAFT_225323 [Capitella teleta]|uniref:Mediator of RNA polymerase II transcription subunit 4 n=1 Tax=Capitella teleta TaxID=283909 RepID=R7VII4_CAPTE|nr:hypothetical protein CAPTEDRAFT_225323 [Capitella teleta]|eukprot:ELU18352.1 hypothetical protein CAPTEDRAFT_225323 [Capitella teleta]
MAAPSTRQRLLSSLDDVEIVSKELLKVLTAPTQSDDSGMDQLIQLLVQKDKEIQTTLTTAKEQGKLQRKYEALKAEVENRDQDIRQLQKSLKDVESTLSTAIYQAKAKLKAVTQANGRKISSEDLIKYAHKISASNAVAAPSTWAIGDPRRPYPTEIDMRLGILAKLGDPTISNQALQQQASFPESMNTLRPQPHLEQALNAPQPPPPQQSGLSWQHSVEMQPNNLPGHHSGLTPPTAHHPPPHFEQKHKDHEDVEIMSSDSSSSSSSDE